MAITVTINGSSYSVPESGEKNWADQATDILVALSGNSLYTGDVVNDDTTGGAAVPASAEIVKTHGGEIDLNTTHRGSDGKDHSDVVLNNTHRTSDGKNHSDVVLNNTHRTSDGTDHTYIDQDWHNNT